MELMTFPSPTIKTFYRCFTLPIAIAKAEKGSEREKSLTEELKRRQTEVKLMGLKNQCAAYIKAQRQKQATYDAMIAAQTIFSNEPSKKTEEAYQLAEVELANVRETFKKTYH